MPSWDALSLHCKRANYVISILLHVASTKCPIVYSYDNFGWKVHNNEVHIDWGKVDKIIKHTVVAKLVVKLTDAPAIPHQDNAHIIAQCHALTAQI